LKNAIPISKRSASWKNDYSSLCRAQLAYKDNHILKETFGVGREGIKKKKKILAKCSGS
jgi:hypothetical protein